MEDISELKRCPFCGSKFEVSTEPQDNHPVAGMAYIYHDYGPPGSAARECFLRVNQHFVSEKEAIAAWNKRAVLPIEREIK